MSNIMGPVVMAKPVELSCAWTSFRRTRESGYEPLPDDKSIRMLTLEPGEKNDQLRGIFDVINIDSIELGNHEALSYVWGAVTGDHTIVIRSGGFGREIRITPHLDTALRQLRLAERSRSIWVDQICINQENFGERSHQIQFMNRLYKRVGRILVWLGPDRDSVAGLAFNFVLEMDKIFLDDKTEEEFHFAYIRGLGTQPRESWVYLDRLLELEWFTRGWIVQEIGTGTPATLIWGSAEIDWLVLSRVCERLQTYYHFRSRFKIRTDEVRYLFQRFVEPSDRRIHDNRFSFMYELHRARRLKFSDQRDRVFAFLGHFSRYGPNEELRGISADYTRTVTEVYKDVAKRALTGEVSTTDGSALIALAAVQHTGPGIADGLPSWVPDWRIFQSFMLTEPASPHKAHGTSRPRLEVDDNCSLMRICGLEIDTIEACSRPLGAGEFNVNSSREHKSTITYIWQSICRQDRFDMNDAYLNGESSVFAFMQTLSNGCVQIAKRKNVQYSKIPKSRWLKHAASYLVQALTDSHVLAPNLRAMAGNVKQESEAEQWSRSANGASENRCFARSRKGYYVLGPGIMAPGDIICVLFGGKLPFCLRPCGRRYLLVGECYVHGLMEGEAMQLVDRGELSEKVFDIL